MNGQHNGTNAQHPHRENWNARACAGMFSNTQSNSSPGTKCVAINGRNQCGGGVGGAAEELARRGMWCLGHVPWCVSECAVRALDYGVDVGRGARVRDVYMRSVGRVDSSFTSLTSRVTLLGHLLSGGVARHAKSFSCVLGGVESMHRVVRFRLWTRRSTKTLVCL